MEFTIDVRNAWSHLSTEAPHLHHINFTRLIVPTRIPRNNLLTFCTNVRYHFGYKCLVPKIHFICSNMEIRKFCKSFTNFIHQQLQNFHTLRTLHIVTERTHESSTMTWHINFRNQQHVVFFTESHQFLGFLNSIILSLQTGHVHAIVQHRENLAFQTPCLVFSQMPMKHIDFITGKDFNFLLQFIQRQIASAYVVHKATNLECRPIDDFISLYRSTLTILHHQLAQSLNSPIHAFFSHGFYFDALASYFQTISFFLIQFGTCYFRDQLHGYFS